MCNLILWVSKKKPLWGLLFALFILPVIIKGQVRFSHVTYSNGLSSNDVRGIAVDKDGFIWVATANGLCRYDGRHFLTFKHIENDTTSLPEDDLDLVFCDNKGFLWVGGYKTCTRIDLSTGKFKHLKSDKKNPRALTTTSITAFAQDKENNIWIGTRAGLARYNEKENRVYRYFTNKDYFDISKKLYYENRIVNIAVDNNNNLWCGTLDGVNKLNIKTGKFTRYAAAHADYNVLLTKRIKSVLVDGRGMIWISYYNGGLSILNPVTNAVKHLYNDGTTTFVGLWMDEENNIWASTSNKELMIFNSEGRIQSVYKHNDYDKLSISDDVVTSKCKAGKNIWLGTLRHGLQMMNTFNGFQSYYRQPGSKGSLPEENINNIAIVDDSNVLVSHDKGMGFYNLNNQVYSPYLSHSIYIDNILNNGVGQLYKTPDGQYWAAVNSGALRIDKQKKAHYYTQVDSNKYSFSGGTVFAFYKKDKNPLIICASGSLNIYDSIHDRFMNKQSVPALNHLFPEFYVSMAIDTFKHYWVATSAHGLLELDSSFKELHHYVKNKNQLPGNNVTQVILKRDTLWVATTEGLALVNVRRHNITTPSFNKSFISKYISAISLLGNTLWMSTDNGIGSVSKRNGQWHTNWFDETDGLLCKEFSQAGVDQNRPNIFFTGTNGIVLLNTNNVMPKIISPSEIKLTDFKVFDEHVLNPLIVPHANSIKLKYNQNFFSFSFSALDYPLSEKMHFAYKLIGLEDSAHNTGSEASGSYTNVPPGEYILEIYAVDFASKSIGVGRRISIIISPAFWQTWWFKILLSLLALFMVYLIYMQRLRQIHAKQKLEMDFNKRLADIKLTALLAQMNPHFVFNSLSAINSMILNARNDEASNYLHKFSRLMRTVLDASDKKYIILEKELNLLKHYLDMEHMRFGQKFSYHINIDEKIDTSEIYIPPMLLQPIVENSIKHGITHIDEPGFIVINVNRDVKTITIQIDDNGPGLQNKTSRHKIEHVSKGLKLTKERVEMISQDGINGTLTINNIETYGRVMGVRVTIVLPLINSPY